MGEQLTGEWDHVLLGTLYITKYSGAKVERLFPNWRIDGPFPMEFFHAGWLPSGYGYTVGDETKYDCFVIMTPPVGATSNTYLLRIRRDD